MIDKYRVLAALVRSFFDAFINGVMDGKGLTPTEKQQPDVVRKTIMEHYDKVAVAFHETMLQPIAGLNYSFDELEKALQSSGKTTISAEKLMEIACLTPRFHSAMVEEYKRNFMKMLQGGRYTVSEHLELYVRHSDAGDIEIDHAIRSVVAAVMRTYFHGLALVEGGQYRQATVLRLMMGAMSVLLRDVVEHQPVPEGSSELGAMFLKVCGTPHNVSVMANEMDAQMLDMNE